MGCLVRRPGGRGGGASSEAGHRTAEGRLAEQDSACGRERGLLQEVARALGRERPARKESQRGGGAEASPHWEGPPGAGWALRPAVARRGEICAGRTGRWCPEVLATRSPTCRPVLGGLLLRPVHLPGARGGGWGGLPSKGQGLLGLKDKGGRGQGKERVAGLNGPEEKKNIKLENYGET